MKLGSDHHFLPSFLHSFIHLFILACFVLGPELGAGDSEVDIKSGHFYRTIPEGKKTHIQDMGSQVAVNVFPWDYGDTKDIWHSGEKLSEF